MTPEEVTELSEEEQIYFSLLELHLRGIPDIEETHTLIEPVSAVRTALSCLLVALVLCVPWIAIGLIVYVILT